MESRSAKTLWGHKFILANEWFFAVNFNSSEMMVLASMDDSFKRTDQDFSFILFR